MALAAPSLSCVVCAYNEAGRIAQMLSAVVGHPLLKEVIVIDDGSTDSTAEIARAHHATTVISRWPNRGKSRALAEGIRVARGHYLMLLDADLHGLKPHHVDALAAPVLEGTADVSLSLRGNSLPVYRALGLDFVSGERVLPRSLLLEKTKVMSRLPGWAPEVFMNQLIIEQRLRVAVVDWKDVTHTPKHRKRGRLDGAVAEGEMIRDALRTFSPADLVRQNIDLLRLKRGRRHADVQRCEAPDATVKKLRWGIRA